MKNKVHTNRTIGIFVYDIFIEPNLIIECNGKHHYLVDTAQNVIDEEFNGKDIIKHEFAHRDGYNLVVLDDHKLNWNDKTIFERQVLEKLDPFLKEMK